MSNELEDLRKALFTNGVPISTISISPVDENTPVHTEDYYIFGLRRTRSFPVPTVHWTFFYGGSFQATLTVHVLRSKREWWWGGGEHVYLDDAKMRDELVSRIRETNAASQPPERVEVVA